MNPAPFSPTHAAGPIFPRFDDAVEASRGALACRGNEIGPAAVLRHGARGALMYPVVYWAGLTTLLLWTAFSAYSAIMGL